MPSLEYILHGILAQLNVAFCRELMRERQLLDRAGMLSVRVSEWQGKRLSENTDHDCLLQRD